MTIKKRFKSTPGAKRTKWVTMCTTPKLANLLNKAAKHLKVSRNELLNRILDEKAGDYLEKELQCPK